MADKTPNEKLKEIDNLLQKVKEGLEASKEGNKTLLELGFTMDYSNIENEYSNIEKARNALAEQIASASLVSADKELKTENVKSTEEASVSSLERKILEQSILIERQGLVLKSIQERLRILEGK